MQWFGILLTRYFVIRTRPNSATSALRRQSRQETASLSRHRQVYLLSSRSTAQASRWKHSTHTWIWCAVSLSAAPAALVRPLPFEGSVNHFPSQPLSKSITFQVNHFPSQPFEGSVNHFPSQPLESQRKVWTSNVKIKGYTWSKTHLACFLHFAESDYVISHRKAALIGYKPGRFQLLPHAIPSHNMGLEISAAIWNHLIQRDCNRIRCYKAWDPANMY